MSDLNSYEEGLAVDLAKAEAKRDEYFGFFVHWRKAADLLTEQLEAARADAKEAEAYAEELEQRLTKAVAALRGLIQHTHNCEKELTEELHHQDFCGESLPLTKARAVLAEIGGEG